MKLTLDGSKKSTIYLSFFLTFLFLAGSTLVTLLGALSSYQDYQKYLKAALVSETCVNVIAGITYFYFLKYLYEDNLSLKHITPLRYLDWFITTPFLIYSFALFSSYEESKKNKSFKKLDYVPLSYIIVLNAAMLIFGFLGETGKMNKNIAFGLGISCFAATFYFIYDHYVKGKEKVVEIIYYIFMSVWLLYGFSYFLKQGPKNISYNILDMVSKSAFGIYLWITSVQDLDGDFMCCDGKLPPQV